MFRNVDEWFGFAEWPDERLDGDAYIDHNHPGGKYLKGQKIIMSDLDLEGKRIDG